MAKFVQFIIDFHYVALADAILDFFQAGDMSKEAEVRHYRRPRRAVITRRSVPLSGQQPGLVEFGSGNWSRKLLEPVFDDSICQFNWGYMSLVS